MFQKLLSDIDFNRFLNVQSSQIWDSRKNDSYGKSSEQNGLSAGRVNFLFLDQVQQPIYWWKLVKFPRLEKRQEFLRIISDLSSSLQ